MAPPGLHAPDARSQPAAGGRPRTEWPLLLRTWKLRGAMKPSAFNVRVPLAGGEVFLMNTLTDAQIVVSDDVVSLLDRLDAGTSSEAAAVQGEPEALETLAQNSFLVRHVASERAALESHFAAFREDSSQLRITVLTTLRCNFA